MKVYELITELSKLPAGADVEFAMLMTVDEFTKCEIVDEIDGKNNYRVKADIKEVMELNKERIVLYP